MALRLSEAKIESEHGKQLVEWLRAYKYSYGKRVHVVVNTEDEIRLRIYTARNCYGIHAHIVRPDYIYFACEASTRAPRPGEDWTRGNDLPDGQFSQELLHEIMGSIVFYEALEVAKDIEWDTSEEEVKEEALVPKAEVEV